MIKILIKSSSSDPNKNAVIVSEKQRMLSQRIALFMLLDNYGLEGNYKEERDYSFAISRYTSQLLRKAKKSTRLNV